MSLNISLGLVMQTCRSQSLYKHQILIDKDDYDPDTNILTEQNIVVKLSMMGDCCQARVSIILTGDGSSDGHILSWIRDDGDSTSRW